MMKTKYKPRIFSTFRDSEKGFSLVEAAIGLMLLGVVTTGMLATYNVVSEQESDLETRGRLRGLDTSLNAFYMNGGARYPCPAALNLAEGDENFGKEGNCTLASIKPCSDATWKTSEGICKTDNTVNAVIIGGVPFNTLKISYSDTLDVWNNKIIYAVTHQKTNATTFDLHAGAIKIWTMDDKRYANDGLPDEKDFTANPADVFLFSTGDNGVGGFTKDGIALPRCGVLSTGFETINCDFNNIFLSEMDPDYPAGARSLKPGPTYFDDLTLYKIKIRQSIWFPQPIHEEDVLTLADNVGIGTTDPKYSLHVVGNVYAPNQVRTKSYCDNNMGTCFDPETITGTKPVMTCNSDTSFGDQVVLHLANNRVYCASPVDRASGAPIGGDAFKLNKVKFPVTDCYGNGQLMAGFDATGKPVCRNP